MAEAVDNAAPRGRERHRSVSKHDKAQPTFIDLCLAGERHSRKGNIDRAIAYYNAAIRVSTDNMAHLGALHCQLGGCYYGTGDYARSITHHKKDLHIARKMSDKEAECAALSNIANTNKALGNVDKTVDYLKKALAIAQTLGNDTILAGVLDALGNAFHSLGNSCAVKRKPTGHADISDREKFNKAVKYYRHNVEKKENKDDKRAMARVCSNMGTTFEQLRDYDQAALHYLKRCNIAKDLQDSTTECDARGQLGSAYYALGKYNKAVEQYLIELQLAKELEDDTAQALAHANLARVYETLRDFPRAIDHYDQHLGLLNLLGNKTGMTLAYGNLGKANEQARQFERAIECYKQQVSVARSMSDRVSELEAQKRLARAVNLQDEYTSGEESSEGEGNAWVKSGPAVVLRRATNGASSMARRISRRRKSVTNSTFMPNGVELGDVTTDSSSTAPDGFGRSTSDPGKAKLGVPSQSNHNAARFGSPLIARRFTATKDTVTRSLRRVSMLFSRKPDEATRAQSRSRSQSRSPHSHLQETSLGGGDAQELSEAMSNFTPVEPKPAQEGAASNSALSKLTAKSNKTHLAVSDDLANDYSSSPGPRRIEVKPSPNVDRRASAGELDQLLNESNSNDVSITMRSNGSSRSSSRRNSGKRLSQDFTALVIEASPPVTPTTAPQIVFATDEITSAVTTAPTPAPETATSLPGKYIAIFTYNKADTDEVSFEQGDQVKQVSRVGEGWFHGTIQRTGQTGLIPSNYVKPQSELEASLLTETQIV